MEATAYYFLESPHALLVREQPRIRLSGLQRTHHSCRPTSSLACGIAPYKWHTHPRHFAGAQALQLVWTRAQVLVPWAGAKPKKKAGCVRASGRTGAGFRAHPSNTQCIGQSRKESCTQNPNGFVAALAGGSVATPRGPGRGGAPSLRSRLIRARMLCRKYSCSAPCARAARARRLNDWSAGEAS